jgi:1,4-dihydroxy-2-naphthoyl-CoA hydrolase
MLFKTQATPASLQNFSANTLVATLGIEFTEVGNDYLCARMPVEARTCQPYGILHGGASAALAETLGSIAASLCLDPARQIPVGLELNANHIRSISAGFVYGTARPIHVGRSTHVWEIRIEDERERLVCISRLTVLIKNRDEP